MLEVAGCQAGGPRTLSSPIDTGLALITPTPRLVKNSRCLERRDWSTRVHLLTGDCNTRGQTQYPGEF